MNNHPILLVADDSPDDRLLIERAWRQVSSVTMQTVEDGEAVMKYLDAHLDESSCHPLFSVLLLDLNMPRKNGFEVLEAIKIDPRLKTLPIIVFSTSSSSSDVDYCYRLGANSYITKPDSFEGLVDLMQALHNYWFKAVQLPG